MDWSAFWAVVAAALSGGALLQNEYHRRNPVKFEDYVRVWIVLLPDVVRVYAHNYGPNRLLLKSVRLVTYNGRKPVSVQGIQGTIYKNSLESDDETRWDFRVSYGQVNVNSAMGPITAEIVTTGGKIFPANHNKEKSQRIMFYPGEVERKK